MKLRVKERIIEEAAITITRSSPRTRKRDPDQGLDGLEPSSPASKRVKKQNKENIRATTQVVKQEADLDGIQINGDSQKPSPRRRPKAGTSKAEEIKVQDTQSAPKEEAPNGSGGGSSTRKRKGRELAKKPGEAKEQQIDVKEEEKVLEADTSKKRKGKPTEVSSEILEAVNQDTDIEDEKKDIDAHTPPKPKRKRKTKEEKEVEAMPLAVRTTGLRMYVGAHVSIAKGLQNSITNCHHIGGNAFALFLKSQRKWDNPTLTDESRDAFRSHCQLHKYDAASHVLPHGSYLVNLAHEDAQRAKQAYDAFLDDLHRCERLGIKLYNFHPGASGSSPLPEAIKRIANKLNTALSATKTVTPLLENMAGSGTVIGSRFSDLRDLISHIKPEFRHRIGVCLDTCHAFAAGYDLRTPDSFRRVLQDFDDTVGIKYLKALHVNDSKAPLGSKRDLHQNIGLGFLGLRAFHNVMNEVRFEGLPLILETPCEKPDPEHGGTGKKKKKMMMVEDKAVWAREIKLLEGLIGMDVHSDAFRRLEAELSERGSEEREKMIKAVDAKAEKARRKVEKGQRSLVDMMRGSGKGKGLEKKKKKEGKEGRDGGAESSSSLSSAEDSDAAAVELR